MPASESWFRTGVSQCVDPLRAAEELRSQIAQPDPELILFFCSSRLDPSALSAAMSEAFPGVLVVGCTTAGEITPIGYLNGAVVAVSLGRGICHAEAVLIERLSSFAYSLGLDAVRQLSQRMAAAVGAQFGARSFAMLLIDGMSGAEDAVLSALHTGLPHIPLFGGSAGDDLSFRRTFVCKNGRACTDAAVLMMIHTHCPFRVFKTQHFVGSGKRMVITGADPVKRIVTEINAEPAAREFARIIGLDVGDLSPMIFATHPVVVRVGGADYVRSIQKVNDDGSLSFFCAIDEGLVLSVGNSIDPYRSLEDVIGQIRSEIGPPQLTIGLECVLRLLEMERNDLKQHMAGLMVRNNVIGFNTYGEQFSAMHVNQTFTGVALGCPSR